jgi:hypothetical protein
VNKEEDTYRAYISPKSLNSLNACTSNLGSAYHPKEQFTAFNANLRPIPYGMKVICFKLSKDQPTRTTKVEVVYDFFIEEEGCVNLITYTEPVPGTIPLYLFSLGEDNVFPSFTKQPPTKWWKELSISPIFVLKGIVTNLKFTCLNGKCIPVLSNKTENKTEKEEGTSFEECLRVCSKQKPKNILEMVKDEDLIRKRKFELAGILIFFTFLSFLLILILVYFFLAHK